MASREIKCNCDTIQYGIQAVIPPVQHSEGPHWDPSTNTLYFVDTFNATAYRYCPDRKDDQITNYKIDGRDSIGVIIPIKDKKDNFVVTSDRYIYELHWPLDKREGNLNNIHFIEEDKPKNQFNDGKADSRGRLWTGTLTREADYSVSPNGGHLYQFILGQKVSKQIENVSISNGLAWSRDNKMFFFTDSLTRKVVLYDFDEEEGRLGNNKVLFDMEDHPTLKGLPDGLAIDVNDNLWIALYGGHGLIHVDGKTGKLIKFIKLPATYCTSACFGGPKLDTLFVTTSKMKLEKEELKEEPQAGAIFALKNLGVTGPAPFNCVL